jgi:hypothetical protein
VDLSAGVAVGAVGTVFSTVIPVVAELFSWVTPLIFQQLALN